MTVAAELDLAIQQVDALLSRLQGDSAQAAQPSLNPPAVSNSVPKTSKPSRAAPDAIGNENAEGTPAATLGSTTQAVNTDAFAKAHLQVAHVLSVDEIDSVKLYKCTVELGSGVTKQVMAGLKQHMAKGDLLHSLVVVITNLKAAKLAGEASEAMILAAQAPVPDAPNGELVKVLQPPEGSAPGDAVYLEGDTAGAGFPKTLKSDIWKKIVAELQVYHHTACYAQRKLVTSRGSIQLSADMPDGAGIH